MDLGAIFGPRNSWPAGQHVLPPAGASTGSEADASPEPAPVLGQQRRDSWQPSASDPGQADKPAAGAEEADDPAKQQETAELAARDREVRMHEAAHQAAGGGLAGAASFSYETGPDGKRYAVGGEVSIDMGSERDPAATIAKMQRVRAAALAPADPSSQDMAVASQASQIEAAARQQLREETAAKLNGGRQDGSPSRAAKPDSAIPNADKPEQIRRAYAPAVAIGSGLDATA